MLAERGEQRPATWAVHTRRALAWLVVGSIPAVIMLAVLVGAVPPAINLQAEAIAYALYFISLLVVALLLRNLARSAAAGLVVGVLVTSGVVILNVIVAAAHAVAAGGY